MLTSWLAHMSTFSQKAGSLGYSIPFGQVQLMWPFQEAASVPLKSHGLKKKNNGFSNTRKRKGWAGESTDIHYPVKKAVVTALVCPVVKQRHKVNYPL